jgi:preprotein translocase subunit SecE
MLPQKTLKKGNAISGFFGEVRDEARQITWPTRQKTFRLTLMVIISTVAVGAYLGALDYLFTYAMGFII